MRLTIDTNEVKELLKVLGTTHPLHNKIYMQLDTEDRERVSTYFEELMDIVGLQSSDGKLNQFIYGFDPNEIKNEN